MLRFMGRSVVIARLLALACALCFCPGQGQGITELPGKQ
jgi:hypothetical protein